MTASLFAGVELAPRDPILGLSEAFAHDSRDHKVNLGVGVYLNEEGKVPVLRAVAEAERRRAAHPTPYRSPGAGSSVRASFCVRMPMTGRSFAIASSTSRTDFRRPTSIGMIEPGNSTELRSGRMGSTSGISTGRSAPGFAFVIRESYSSPSESVKATCLI